MLCCTNYVPFLNWCAIEIPSIFNQELTYEMRICALQELCKNLLENEEQLKEAVEALGTDVQTLQKQIQEIMNMDYAFLKDLIEKAIKNVWFGLTQSGYFVAYIPDSWSEITFNTTGLDINVPNVEYGHLVLSY